MQKELVPTSRARLGWAADRLPGELPVSPIPAMDVALARPEKQSAWPSPWHRPAAVCLEQTSIPKHRQETDR